MNVKARALGVPLDGTDMTSLDKFEHILSLVKGGRHGEVGLPSSFFRHLRDAMINLFGRRCERLVR